MLGSRGERHGPFSPPSSRAQKPRTSVVGSPLLWAQPPCFLSTTEAVSAYSCIVQSPCSAFLALSPAGLSSTSRSPVTGQGAKSLFAKHSLSGVYFLLALPLKTRLRAHSQGTCGGKEWSVGREKLEKMQPAWALTLGWEPGALRCQMGPLPSRPSLCQS